jgi:Ca2+-dependent lipid-binding protein
MDFSKLVVNVRQARDKENNTKKFGRCSFEVSKMVRNSMQLESGEYTEHATLLDCPGGKVKLGVTFIPIVQFKLDPRESLENQGHLTVTAVKANDLMAADKSGTSDVFIRFYLNDQRVFKTQTYKKTLNPVFGKDEKFTLPVHDRTVAHLVAKIFDWDQIGKDTLLGECTIPFTGDEIETFRNTTKELVIPDRGRFTVALLWRPELVARKRTNTSLFSATTRVFTHAPSNAFGAGKDAGGKVIGAGTKVFGTGVSAIGSGIRGIGKMGRSSSTSSNSIISKSSSNNDIPPVPVIPLFRDLSSDFSESAGDIEEGAMVNITIIEARNLKAMDRGGTSDPYCRVHMRNKAIYKTRHLKKTLSPDWSESFNCKVTSSSIDFKVKDHNKLNNDVDIGEHHLQLFENVKHGQAFDGWLPLVPEGTGELHVRVALVDSDVVSIASKSSRSSRLFGRR